MNEHHAVVADCNDESNREIKKNMSLYRPKTYLFGGEDKIHSHALVHLE